MTINHSPSTGLWADILTQEGRFPAYAQEIAKYLPHDIPALMHDMGFIFAEEKSVPERTNSSAAAFHRWHVREQMGKRSPSLVAMCLFALRGFGIPADNHVAVLTGAVLGDAENALAYHGNLHYKKVLLQTVRLIAAHNRIYKDTTRVLDQHEIALLMVAACVHDVDHDGLGNTIQGVFQKGRLERGAFEKSAPFLRLAGMSDDDLRCLFVMILTTEVSVDGTLSDPAAQMKSAYRYHFMGEHKTIERLNLDEDLALLETDKRLCMMALLLHEADIATSAGVCYEVTKHETTLYRAEIGKHDAAPRHVVEFLEKICKRQFLSDAGQSLYSANMARIYELAGQDAENGDAPYPPAEHSEFMLSLDHSADIQGDGRTIN